MKLTDIVNKTDKELDSLVAQQRTKLAELHIDYRTKKVANIKEMTSVKKSIARALTIRRQREILALEAAVTKGKQK